MIAEGETTKTTVHVNEEGGFADTSQNQDWGLIILGPWHGGRS